VTEESRDSLSYNSDFASKAALQRRHNSLVQDWKEESFSFENHNCTVKVSWQLMLFSYNWNI